MSRKKMPALVASMLFITLSSSAVPFSYDYKLHGKVVGILASSSPNYPCYIAVKDLSGSSRSYYYHSLNNAQSCAMSRLAYITGEKIYLWGKVTKGNNDGVAIEFTNDKVNWWR